MKVKDISNEKTYAVKVSSAKIISAITGIILHMSVNYVLWLDIHRCVGSAKVRDLEARSAGAVEGGSHHPGRSQSQNRWNLTL